MNSRTTRKFRASFARLPKQVQTQARIAYRTFKRNPSHPSLRFKKVHSKLPIYSARISRDCDATLAMFHRPRNAHQDIEQ